MPTDLQAVPASHYDYDTLAALYNQTRVDYIVPMPMNAQRMQEYVTWYDIRLEESVVVTQPNGTAIGLAMLGMRGTRAWITRLGVNPEARVRGAGHLMMDHLLANARRCGAVTAQLEVIAGNDPALRLFQKLGFAATRELLVIRRAPKPHTEGTEPLGINARELSESEIQECLKTRVGASSWVDDTRSLLNVGALQGVSLSLYDGSVGWAVFMCTRFQIQHIVLQSTPLHDPNISFALLYEIHKRYPNRDTKVENIPLDAPAFAAYQRLGYLVAFRRLEMWLTL